VVTVPGFYDQALEACRDHAAESNATFTHAYDQPAVVAGQGTLARELSAQVPGVDRVVVAVGGGGLIGGIACWIRDDALVVAVEPEACPSMHRAIEFGAPTPSPVGGIAASALGAVQVGEIAWGAARWIDHSVLVSEDEIVAAQRWLWSEARVAAEPAAATTVAALMTERIAPDAGETVVAVISGANFDPATLD
jgi:threonine dehydratase